MISYKALAKHYDELAPKLDRPRPFAHYYHQYIQKIVRSIVPPGSKVIEIGCGRGDLLNALKPSVGVGIDMSHEMVALARQRHPHLRFEAANIETWKADDTYDYIICSDLLGGLVDIWQALRQIRQFSHEKTRLVITSYNYLWQPLLRLAEKIGLKLSDRYQNWLSPLDISNLLYLSEFEPIWERHFFAFPLAIPWLSNGINRMVAQIPGLCRLGLVHAIVARPRAALREVDHRVTVLVPCKNERGNIEACVRRTPDMGLGTELMFVDGNSSDGTVDEIQRCIRENPQRDIKLIPQGDGQGKADAVRKGFAAARGDVLIILDADLTVAPEDLPKFYAALRAGKAEFINGTRLVYPLEKDSMRTLNAIANKFFSMAFSWLLQQPLRDTLCGTKVMFKQDWQKIEQGRRFMGDWDPFGDFDLLFGAARLGLKIVEIPVRYHGRVYGETKIRRFYHGWKLLRMCFVAFRKFKWEPM